ncbi:MAG: hypothetical protein ACR2JY_08700 [Chloroflexota bacterium]
MQVGAHHGLLGVIRRPRRGGEQRAQERLGCADHLAPPTLHRSRHYPSFPGHSNIEDLWPAAISTELPAPAGFADGSGLVEKLLNPPVLRRIYRKELRQLTVYIRSKSAGAATEPR